MDHFATLLIELDILKFHLIFTNLKSFFHKVAIFYFSIIKLYSF